MGLIDALADPQFRRDVYNGVTDTAGRSVAGALGAPVDIAEQALNLGLAGTGWLGRETSKQGSEYMPGLISHAVGGSEWIGEKMRQAGLISDQRNPVAEFLGGLIQPGGSGAAHAATSFPALADVSRGADALAGLGGIGGVLWRKGEDYMLQGLKNGGRGSGIIDIGDVTVHQGARIGEFGEPAATTTVRMTDPLLQKIYDTRILRDGYTPEEVVSYMRQAMRKDSDIVRDPAKSKQHPALAGLPVVDPVTGKRYTPSMPLFSDGDAFYPASVFPDGLPPRKK